MPKITELKKEVQSYTDKTTGEIKEAINYYVDYQGIKVQLRPADFTGREILNVMVATGLITE